MVRLFRVDFELLWSVLLEYLQCSWWAIESTAHGGIESFEHCGLCER